LQEKKIDGYIVGRVVDDVEGMPDAARDNNVPSTSYCALYMLVYMAARAKGPLWPKQYQTEKITGIGRGSHPMCLTLSPTSAAGSLGVSPVTAIHSLQQVL
jgi:hypothetical protein